MIKIIITFLFYTFLFFNSYLSASENDKKLKIGLLAPFSGEYKNLGESLLLSTQLALDEIGNENVIIVPRDSGSNDREELNKAIKEIRNSGAKVIIGPMTSSYFEELEKYEDSIFISLSNKEPKISSNIISVGISLESQLEAIVQLLAKEEREKTIILYPKNEYEKFIDKKIKSLKLKNYKVFKYNSDPRILTGEIEKLTNYSQRKKNLERRKKILKPVNNDQSKKELAALERLYTLGTVDFDSVIIIDFGNSLKSVLSSLVYTDVDDKTVLITYDALGLIYYVWNKNNGINNISDFFIKEKIKGKIGTFKFKDKKVSQQLKIYKTENNKFKEY